MIRLDQVSLQRGGKVLLEEASLSLHHGQHLGLVGANGCGKSSLFALLTGVLQADQGQVDLPARLVIAHMAQEVEARTQAAVDYVLDGDERLREIERGISTAEATDDNQALAHWHAELELHHGYSARSRAEQLLHGLGFSQAEIQRPVADFSGGWRMRLNLARTLMSPSDLLLLDEPTNHLDLDAILWLEGWLRQYPGTLLIISHDRDFLDAVVDQIAHIEQHRITQYRGNYSAFERTRAERLAQQQAAHEKQQRERAHMQSYIDRFRAKATKAKQAQSRLKALARLEEIAPAHVDSKFHFRFPEADKFSSPLLSTDKLALGYPGKTILGQVKLSILPGSRIGLLGPNGAGKSTLIKTLAGELSALGGELKTGEHLKIGYFAQHQLEKLDLDASCLLHLQRLSPTATEQSLRDFIGGFGFRGPRAEEPIRDFSGGEKARLALALIAWEKPNLLLLDEPTNHLDLEVRHALTMALQEYEGAMILVSHDRHLIRNCVDDLLLVADGQVQPWEQDLDDYARWLEQARREARQAASSPADNGSASQSAAERKEQKRLDAEKRAKLRPLKKALEKLEQQLEQVQEALAGVEAQLADSGLYSDARKGELKTCLAQQSALKQQEQTIEEDWMVRQEELEQLEQELA